MIGTVVGNYKIIERIGEGGMGAVFKGVDLMLEREVAIKVLKPELASQPQVVERFRSEAVTLAKLNHPNIATLFNFFRQGDNFFMVMEYVNGTPLDKIIEASGVLTCEQAIPLFCQMLEGIDHAHAYGIVHRDIKPANMMFTESGMLKVLDFGIARALGTARMTRAGHLIGTIEYMSPEQVRGMETDARSDIYSLGMVLYEMVTGHVPFASDSEFELMKAQVEQLPRPPREFSPNIPEQVEWAILCATEKDPEKRFQTAGAFGEAIVDSVNTAIASGALSQIDMRRSTSRLSSLTGDLMTPRLSMNSSPGLALSQPPVSAEAPQPVLENRTAPPPTRLANDAMYAASAAPTTGTLKPTRIGEAADYSQSPVSVSPVMPPAAAATGKLNSKHYIIGGVLGGALLCVLILSAVAVHFLRQARAARETTETTPSSSSTSSNSETVQRPAPVAESTVAPSDSRVTGAPESNAPQDTTQPLPGFESAAKTAPRKTVKPKNDAAARERERAAREALNHK